MITRMKKILTVLMLTVLCLSTVHAERSPGDWWIAKKGLENNPWIKRGVLDVTLYDGWEGNAVDPTGVKDSTKALQKAIDDARDFEFVALFPAGTYKISDTLNCMKRTQWNEKQKQ